MPGGAEDFIQLQIADSSGKAERSFVTVRASSVTNRFEAYARVEPVAVLLVRAAHAGVLPANHAGWPPSVRTETG